MPGPRSHKLVAADITSSGVTTLATVPSGEAWLIKYTNLSTDATAPGALALFAASGSVSFGIQLVVSPAQGGFYDNKQLYVVLEAGDELKAYTGSVVGGSAHAYVGGLIFEV